jgi:hypothetical protein
MNKRPNEFFPVSLVVLALATVFSAQLLAKDAFPETSHDGLQLKKHTRHSAVYVKPGETLDGYDKIAMTDVFVSFKKDWQRNYNDDVAGLDGRVTDKDMEAIKNRLAKEFKVVFTKELQDKGGYEIVTDSAKDVLILRPAIINLVVNAPDVQAAGMETTFVASAGEMTLYLELYDSMTSDLLARVIDAEGDQAGGMAHMGGRVENKAAADRILRRWADTLRKRLDETKTTAASSSK